MRKKKVHPGGRLLSSLRRGVILTVGVGTVLCVSILLANLPSRGVKEKAVFRKKGEKKKKKRGWIIKSAVNVFGLAVETKNMRCLTHIIANQVLGVCEQKRAR